MRNVPNPQQRGTPVIMNLKIRMALCWVLTVSVSVATMGAVMSTSPSTGHRMWIAVGLAWMVLLNGWVWSTLHRRDDVVQGGKSCRSGCAS